MDKNYFQSLLEGVKKRNAGGSIPIYHKNSPIGKFVSKELHDTAFSDLEQREKVKDIIRAGVSRGRIGNAKNISYSFVPDVKMDHKKKKITHRGSTEQGRHHYNFETKNGLDVMVRILHKKSRSKKFKGKSSVSNIIFDVDSLTSRYGPEDTSRTSDATSAIRGVATAVKHHIKSHNPDRIKFSVVHFSIRDDDGRNRVKLYKYMVNKLKNKYDTKIKIKKGYGSKITNFVLTNKRRKKAQTPKTINRNKENQNGIK
jgi:hypothetical protein